MTVVISADTERRVRALIARFGGQTIITSEKDVTRFIDRLVGECAFSTNDPTTGLHQAIRQAARLR